MESGLKVAEGNGRTLLRSSIRRRDKHTRMRPTPLPNRKLHGYVISYTAAICRSSMRCDVKDWVKKGRSFFFSGTPVSGRRPRGCAP
eukprot:7712381-Pyramimonas_sp.AAC.1